MLLVFPTTRLLGLRHTKRVQRGKKPRPRLLLERLEDRLAPATSPVRSGFDQSFLAPNDDSSTALVNLGFTANYFGNNYTGAYVNNNGNVTFGQALGTYTPFGLTGATNIPIIAPFFADVDTLGGGTEHRVRYGAGTVDGHAAFGVNWPGVGYYSNHQDKLNYFQVILIARPDTGAGNFDIEFNYQQIQWETGDASGGSNGLGGQSARAGFSNGSGLVGTFVELAGSGVNGAFLDSNAVTGLSHNSANSSLVGRYVFQVRPNDTTAPVVGLDAPADGALVRGTVTLQASASDNNGVSRVEFYVDGILRGTDTNGSNGWSISLNTAAMGDGSHNWSATAYDLAGNHAAAPNRSFTVDNTPPALTLPANIIAEATSSAGAVVTYSVSAYDSISGPIPATSTPVSGSTFVLGVTTVACSAIDAAGNTATGSFSVTVRDSTPPVISGTPANITVEASSSAGAVVSFASPTASDLVDGVVLVSASKASGSTFALGQTTVTFTGVDAHGNTATSFFDVFVVDSTPPVISGTPANITVEASSSAGAVVSFASPTASDGVDGVVIVSASKQSGDTFAIGTTTVTFTATDSLGHTASSSFTVTVQDTTPPNTSLDGPAAGAVVSGTIQLKASASDNDAVSQVEFYLDGKLLGIDKDGSDGYSISLDTTTLTDGDHSWSTTAYDHAGNQASAAQIFEVDNVPPQINLGANAIVGLGELLSRDGSFTDPGQHGWTAWISYGDTNELLPLAFNPNGNTFQFSHVYTREGDFKVTVTVNNGTQTIFVHAIVGSADNVGDSQTQTATSEVPAETREIQGSNNATAKGTLVLGDGSSAPATLWIAGYHENPVGTTTPGKIQIPGQQAATAVAFFDVRITGVEANTGAQATLVFKFEIDHAAADPVLLFLDPATGTWVPIVGHPTVVTREASPDHPGKDLVTYVLTIDDFSTPKINEMGGTVFTVAVPAPATPPPTANVPTTPAVASASPLGVPFPVLNTATFSSTNRLNLVLRVSQGTELSSSTTTLAVSGQTVVAGNLGDNPADPGEEARIRLANLSGEDDVEFLQRQFNVDWLWRMMNGNGQPARQAQPVPPAAEQDSQQQNNRERQPEQSDENQETAALRAADFVFAELAQRHGAIVTVAQGGEWLVLDRHERIDCGLAMAAAVAGALAAPRIHKSHKSSKRRRSPALANV